MMPSELEYLDSACEMTVLPHPKAPGMAHVPAQSSNARIKTGPWTVGYPSMCAHAVLEVKGQEQGSCRRVNPTLS
jgi:hypothetical protein